ncbi:MAG: NAD(+) synthase [Leptospiraceae bacterium]|nr:NAD(+) synthase [Leptospiraceae bacterium]
MNHLDFGFYRVTSVSPEFKIADPEYNISKIEEFFQKNNNLESDLFLFPELAITGYTCGDLFFQDNLLDKTIKTFPILKKLSKDYSISMIIGFPIKVDGRLFNCAGFFHEGNLLGIVPKLFLPSTNEFYEHRWFTPSSYLNRDLIQIDGEIIPIGTDLIFKSNKYSFLSIGIEICEDLWTVEPPSGKLALEGATLIVNPSASPETLGKSHYRKELVNQQSARCLSAYAYSSSGSMESSTDLVYSGHLLLAENGIILEESREFNFGTNHITTDFDLQKMEQERLKNSSFSRAGFKSNFRTIHLSNTKLKTKPSLNRFYSPTPFVPSSLEKRTENCREIFQIQSTGLARRIIASRAKKLVIGISGGLDSTLALLVCIKALEKLNRPNSDVHAITLPGFGTTTRTKSNAEKLCDVLKVEFQSISIDSAVNQHFKDIGHDPTNHDVTYENSQARERTQILMDISNQKNGIVVGTGDLSELALGWCTYNADHMSMYNVNSGVPKTLVRYMIEYCADYEFKDIAGEILKDICDTPISPELIPHKDDKIVQETEAIVGPYKIHDFFLFYFVRYGFSPEKILYLANNTFKNEFSESNIKDWFGLFIKRFFTNQFKRSAIPDGMKIGSVALSPRGDWRMPSDSEFKAWLI